jgi:hypothetical protein
MENKVISIHQPNYMPWVGYFNKIVNSDIFVFLDNAQFSKGSFTNRNKIKLSNGNEYWLTVPVSVKGKNKQFINEVEINKLVHWEKKHLESIKQSYSKSPFFEKLYPQLFEILTQGFSTLKELNIAIINLILSHGQVRTKIYVASELAIDFGEKKKNDLLISLCKYFSATTYLSGRGALQYNDEMLFKENGINLIYQDFKTPYYQQFHGNYIENLSVIDYLFCNGFDNFFQVIKNQ